MQLSDMPSRKNILQILPNFLFFILFYFKKKTQDNKTCNMEMTSYARQDQT
jgi:hypothetical protein